MSKNKINTIVLDNIPVGTLIIRYDKSGYHLLSANDELLSLLEMTEEQLRNLVAHDIMAISVDEYRKKFQSMLYKGTVIGGKYSEQILIKTSTGRSSIELRLSSEAQTDTSFLLTFVFFDINNYKSFQSKIDEKYSQLLGVMNNTGGFAVLTTVDNRNFDLSFASQGMEKLLQGNWDELRSLFQQGFFQCIHPEDTSRVTPIVENALRNLSHFRASMRFLTAHGQYVWVSVNGSVEDNDGQRILYIAFIESSEERKFQYIQKQIIDNFARREFEYLLYVNSETDTYQILTKNNQSDIFFSSNVGSFEHTINTIICKYCTDRDKAVYLKKLSIKNILSDLSSKDDIEYFLPLKISDGALHYKKIWASWVDRCNHTFALVINDITEEYIQEGENQSLLRNALRAAEQASAAKSEFLSRMSHDIRTPLNAIIGYTDMCLEKTTLAPDIRSHLLNTSESSHFLLSIINDILACHELKAGNWHSLN